MCGPDDGGLVKMLGTYCLDMSRARANKEQRPRVTAMIVSILQSSRKQHCPYSFVP